MLINIPDSLLKKTFSRGLEVLEVTLDVFKTLLERHLDVVDVRRETGEGLLEAVAVFPALDVQLLPVLCDLLLGLGGEGVHQLLQDTELLTAENRKSF